MWISHQELHKPHNLSCFGLTSGHWNLKDAKIYWENKKSCSIISTNLT